VTRTGKYKLFPIIGSVFIGASLGLLSTLTVSTPLWLVCTYLAFMGIGLGLTMQILILVVQNSFPLAMVGTATASNNYFRQIGASLGAAIVGSLFTAKLVTLLGERLPAGAGGDKNSLTPESVQNMPDAIRDVIVGSYNDALTPVFLLMVPVAVISFVLLLLVKEVPLRTTIDVQETVTEAMGIEEASIAEGSRETHELAAVGVGTDGPDVGEGSVANADRTQR